MEHMPEFRLLRPATVAEAVKAKAANPGAQLVAGGTDLMVNLRRGIGSPSALISLAHIVELRSIAREGKWTRIGAGVILADLIRDADFARDYPAVVEAAKTIAGPNHREAATVGGNLCVDTRCIYFNQSEWWRSANAYCLKHGGDKCHVVIKSERCYAVFPGDLAPSLLVLGAEAEIAGPKKKLRRIPLAELYQDEGRTHLKLEEGELLVGVRLPAPGKLVAAYEKIRVRGSIDFPMVGVAASVARKGAKIAALKIAFTGTNSCPVLVAGLEELLGQKLDDEAFAKIAAAVKKTIEPVRSTFAGPKYRRNVAQAVTKRLVKRLFDQAG
jgi:4-hydroxybenzoyl-CoA reductase subunit beta